MPGRPVLRPWLLDAAAYTPGLKATTDDGRLASNELPEPPPWLDDLDIRALELNRYPDPPATALREALAAHHGVSPSEVVVGNGSDELIMLLVQAFAAFTGSIVTATPGYSLYALCAKRLGARVHGVPLSGWHHDLVAMAEVEADIAFVCDPANPTGTVVGPDDLAEFVDRSRARLIVIDEAYVDFVTARRMDTVAAAVRDPRVVVLRTFSKAHGLAGTRVGYLIAHRELTETIGRLRLPFSVNSLAQHLALRALANVEQTRATVATVVETRGQLQHSLAANGIDHVPSQANFVLALSPDSEELVGRLAGHGFAVRPGRDLGVRDALRVTVPTPAAMTRLASALTASTTGQAAR